MKNEEWNGKAKEPLHKTDGYWASDEKSEINIEQKNKQYIFDFDKINTLEDVIKIIKAMDLHLIIADDDSKFDGIRNMIKEV